MSLHVQPVWSLNQTVDSSLAIARGIIRAATNDNVQPLALIACERFGATVAMCSESTRKIEGLIWKVVAPSFVNFLKAQIGYSADDSATQLSRSLAGLQFMALAAPMVSTMPLFDCANALEAMLRSSAADKTLLPTPKQLQALMGVLEHRLVRSGFADSLVGWECLIARIRNLPNNLARLVFNTRASAYPNKDGLEKLVHAFRELNRIGDASSLVIKTSICAAWVIAFTKWCLGVPPSVILENGSPVLEQEDSSVTVVILSQVDTSLEITIYHSLGSPVELITAAAEGSCVGLINLRSYGLDALRRYEFDLENDRSPMIRAIPYALLHVSRKIQLLLFTGSLMPTLPMGSGSPELNNARPFPPDTMMLYTTSLLLGSKAECIDPRPVQDLAFLQDHLVNLKAACSCSRCKGGSVYIKCKAVTAMENLAAFVADALALSLFECPDNLLVWRNVASESREELKKTCLSILNDETSSKCSINDVLVSALDLVGHPINDGMRDGNWVMSAYRGQAVYLKLFETLELRHPGFLQLSWSPGVLNFEGELYSYVTSHVGWRSSSGHGVPAEGAPAEVTKPLNLMPGIHPIWLVTKRDGYLEVSLGLSKPSAEIGPRFAVNVLASSLVLQDCAHNDKDRVLDRSDDNSRYTSPLSPLGVAPGEAGDGKLAVVAVDRSNGLRLLALAFGGGTAAGSVHFVLRGGACLQCAIQICRNWGWEAVIC